MPKPNCIINLDVHFVNHDIFIYHTYIVLEKKRRKNQIRILNLV